MQVQSLGLGDPLEDGMVAHSNILAWRIPWTEEPGGLQSMESQSQTQLKQLSTLHLKMMQSGKCFPRANLGSKFDKIRH